MTVAEDADRHRTPSPAPQEGSRLNRFVGDVIMALAVTFGLLALPWMLMSAGGSGSSAVFLLMFTPLILVLPYALYAIPIAVALFGVAKGRLGFVVGPLALALGVFVPSFVLRQMDEKVLAAIEKSALAPASQPYQLVAVDDAPTACNENCIRFLAVSPYALAMRTAKEWGIYTRGEGDACRADNAFGMRTLLALGYPGTCVLRTERPDIDRALIYRERQFMHEAPPADLPRSFRGRVFEVSERHGGTERLLGRRLTGSLLQPLPLPLALRVFSPRVREVDVGPLLDRNAFLAGAGGLTRVQLEGTPAVRGTPR